MGTLRRHPSDDTFAWVVAAVGARARIAAGTSVGPGAVICAGAEIGTGSAIEQSLVLPHAKPRAPARLRYAVAYEKEYWSDA